MAQGGIPCARGSLVSVRSTTRDSALGVIWWGWAGPGGIRLDGTVCAGQLSTSSRPLGPCSPSSQTLLQGSGLPSAPSQPCPARSCQARSSQASCQPPPSRAGGLLPRTLLSWARGRGRGPGWPRGAALCFSVLSRAQGAVGIEQVGLRVLDVPLPGCQSGLLGTPG